MGLGDEIIVTGIARRGQEANPLPVRVLDKRGKTRWHEIWEGNPRLAPPGFRGKAQTLVDGPGRRGYIERKTRNGWIWREWICPVGEIYLSERERAFGAAFGQRVILEPNLKQSASPNKQWGWARWAELANLLLAEGYPVAQMGTAKARRLKGVEFIVTKNFREACAVLAATRLAIVPEGALHHAAATFGTATIVIFGGYISPLQTGYPHQLNLFTGGKPCGNRARCPHCTEAMERIPVAAVFERAVSLLGVIDVEWFKHSKQHHAVT